MRCAVNGCNNNNQKKENRQNESILKPVQFFRFPKDENVCQEWVIKTGRREKFNVKYSRICAIHFSEENYSIRSRLGLSKVKSRVLSPDAIPTLHLANKNYDEARAKRLEKRQNKKLCNELLKIYEENINETIEKECVQSTSSVDEVVEEVVEDCDDDVMNCDEELEVPAPIVSSNSANNDSCDFLKTIFSKTQIRKLKEPLKRLRWTIEDIASSVSIYSAGPRAYRLLLKKGYPLPAPSTLRFWCKKIKILPGILTSVIALMKGMELTDVEKLTVISFDEMKIRKQYLFDKSADETLKPSNYVQVMIARGLVGNWKQPIFFDYDCKVTQDLLFKCITTLENAGFHVVATVSDLGGSNQNLYKSINIEKEKPYFINPVNRENKIYVFADVPHLVKLLWSHFIDTGFMIDNKKITKDAILELFNKTSKFDLNIAHKLTPLHFTAKGPQRQKVKLATQFFSHSVSTGITRLGMSGKLFSKNWMECAEMIKTVNDWFDVLNVRVPVTDFRNRTKAFGLALQDQLNILNNMSTLTEKIRMVQGRQTLLPFQKGILISNKSLKLLYFDLKEQYDLNFIITYTLNQDVLENFFGVIRTKGGLYDHPTAVEFRYQLRSYLLGRNEDVLTNTGNTEVDNTPNLISDNIADKNKTENEDCSTPISQVLKINDDDDTENSSEDIEDIRPYLDLND